jgi:hypothetical protein
MGHRPGNFLCLNREKKSLTWVSRLSAIQPQRFVTEKPLVLHSIFLRRI